ncbi:F-box protein At3g49450-like [Capsella rubella]|uniref:F-box protein At3g49450-like n=1 Tax=Capsella rubella TaxID=81985 RepID=UPI000CD58D46|nr:F-box protein At3g49450-like [Capsella rubella]
MSANKKLKEHLSSDEAPLTISSTDGLVKKSRTQLPTDLIVEILSRLPAKSVAKSRCVANNWNSLLRDPFFTDVFLKRSSARPRLLLTFQAEGTWYFFSSPGHNMNSNRVVVVDSHMNVPKPLPFRVCVPVRGLLCTRDEWALGHSKERMMICNLGSRQFKYLPRVRSRRCHVVTYLGYDPIGKEYKVLCMTVLEKPFSGKAGEFQVLTLGTSKLEWRMLECSVDHYPYPREICIEGTLYYFSRDYESRDYMLVCFNVKEEKFNFIRNQHFVFPTLTLINYKGKLGGMCFQPTTFMDGTAESLELWVIDDIEKHIWSRHVHIFPPMWKELVAETKVYIVGMINGTTEVVFAPAILSNPFYLFYLDIERKSTNRVEIQGLGPVNGQSIYTFVNHVENVNLIM